MLERVVRKALGDKAKMLLVAPHWPTAEWFKMAMLHAKRRHLIEPGPKVFETKIGEPLPLPFPVWGI